MLALSRKITDFFYNHSTIRYVKDKELYIYGFALMVSTILSFLIVILVSLAFHDIFSGILYFFLFSFLRSYAGGYHCSSYLRCHIAYSIIFIIYQLVKLNFPNCYFFCGSWIGAVYLFYNAPIDNENKRLSIQEKEYFNKIVKIILLILLIVNLMMIHFGLKDYIITINFVLTISAVLAWIGKRGG